jgi:hypothetical protein
MVSEMPMTERGVVSFPSPAACVGWPIRIALCRLMILHDSPSTTQNPSYLFQRNLRLTSFRAFDVSF